MPEEDQDSHDARATLRDHQQARLRELVAKILVSESYYAPILEAAGVDASLLLPDFIDRVPFTTKENLVVDRASNPPFGSNLTAPPEAYTRFCQTSGTTTGQPMPVIDTTESWEAMLSIWDRVYRAAGLVPGTDRIFFAFSFGPFLGFWTAFGAARKDYLSIPGGGMSSTGRLEAMSRYGATVLCSTPTYALRLGEVLADSSSLSHGDLALKTIIVAGEPGGSLPAVRERISELWGGARVFDHHGLTETGPVSFEPPERPGSLKVVGDAFLAEVVDRDSGEEVGVGDVGELVLTTLTRTACPLLRYRTGDLVRKAIASDGNLILEGGILGRCDDMVLVRGVNIYPSAIEEVLRGFPQMVEYQVVETQSDAMAEIRVRVELQPDAPQEIYREMEQCLRDRFHLRVPVEAATDLPRFEFKSKRWIKEGPASLFDEEE